jgi:glycosyltransferase involved in cell wall biosynthesis
LGIRVLFCADSLDGGGSERQSWQLASHLSSSQFHAEFFLLSRQGVYLDRLRTGTPVHFWNRSKGFLCRFPGGLHRSQVRQLTNVLTRRQIGVVYDRGYHSTLVSAPACRRAKVGRISVIVSPPSFDFAGSQERFRGLKYRLLRRAYADPLAITIAVSSSVADDACEFYRLTEDSIIVLPNPVDLDSIAALAGKISPPSAEVMDGSSQLHGQGRLQLPPGPVPPKASDEFRVLLVGRMTAEKGHAILLQAAAEWQTRFGRESPLGLQIYLLGDGPLQGELSDLADRLGLADRVHWLGFRTNPYPWIRQADLICIPSRYEGCPNVALEALALGTPIVASPLDCLKQLLGKNNERGLVVSSTAPGAFADGIQQVIAFPEAAQRRAQHGHSWIATHHDLRSWLSRMQELLNLAVRRDRFSAKESIERRL